MKGQNLHLQLKLDEAKAVFKELYDFMVESVPEGHPHILRATNYLIKVLLCTGEFADAVNYPRSCYECLSSRSCCEESDELADAAESLAAAISNLHGQK
jgi:hypothetical protein